MEKKLEKAKRDTVKEMVSQSIRQDQEAKEKEAVNALDSDENIPFAYSDDEEFLKSEFAYE